MNIVLLGPPGSGKGTQASHMARGAGIVHISTGEIFREALKNKTPLGIQAQNFMSAGQLVPDGVIVPMVEERLNGVDCRNGFILDGFPRTIPQAESLDQFFSVNKRVLDKVILIDVPHEVCILRLSGRRSCSKCGYVYNSVTNPPRKENVCDRCSIPLVLRDDDKRETIEERLKVYDRQTEPLIHYYEKSKRLVRVDGSPEPEMVSKSLKNLV